MNKTTARYARGRRPFGMEHAEDANAFDRLARTLRLDRSSESPLWVQLKNKLEDSIDAGLLEPNTRLPPEQIICEYLNVSKPVVRAALSSLADQGKVVKFPRKGMYVAAPNEYVDFMHTNLGAFSDLTEKGYSVSVKTYKLTLSRANKKEREIFSLSDESEVIRLKRLYRKDNKPITLTHISLPAHRVPGLQKMDLDDKSLLQVIKKKYGLKVTRADRWLSASCPNSAEARLLKVSRDTPLISIRSIGREASGSTLEYYEALLNPKIAEIHLTADGRN